MPNWPLYRLWSQAALEAHKSSDWINGCTDRTTVTATHTNPPRTTAPSANSSKAITRSTPRFSSTTTSATMPSTTRSTASGCPGMRPSPATTPAGTPGTSCAPPVMARAPHRDGRPELGGAAFDTVILQNLTDPPPTPTSSPKPSSCSPRSAACPTASSMSSSCAVCAASPTKRPPPSWAPPWPPSAPTNATQPASWTASSRRPAQKGPPREPHRRTPLQSPPRPQPHHPPRSRPVHGSTHGRGTATRTHACPGRSTQRGGRRPARLCETLLTHTPPTAVADFLTDQVPEPRSALALACVLQLSDTDEGARFWWQYAAGAGQAAAYCLYLHHLAQGESDAANWWHHQTDDVQSLSGSPASAPEDGPEPYRANWWHPANHVITSTSTTILRVLRHLSANTARTKSAAVLRLMATHGLHPGRGGRRLPP